MSLNFFPIQQTQDTVHPAAVSGGQRTTATGTFSDSSSRSQKQTPVFRFDDGDTGYEKDEITETGSEATRLFEGHSLQRTHNNPVPILRRTADWFTVSVIVVVIAFTWIRVFYNKILRQLFAAFFSNSVSNQIVRDENILVQRASILLSFIFYLSSSLFVYQVSIYFNWNYPFLGDGFLRFLLLSFIIAFAYSFKMVLLKGLGVVFDLDRQVATYIFNIFLINNILGLVLIPVVIVVAYVVTDSTQTLIYTGIVLVIISFIYRLVRAFTIWLTLPSVSLFYLILYFCTLEIAPLLLLFKLAMG